MLNELHPSHIAIANFALHKSADRSYMFFMNNTQRFNIAQDDKKER